MELVDIIPQGELLSQLLNSRLIVKVGGLTQEEERLRHEAHREAMEELLKTLILTHELHHGRHECQKLVDQHKLGGEFMHLQRASDDEDIELLTDDL